MVHNFAQAGPRTMYLVMHYAEALYYHNTYQINQVYYQTTVKQIRTGVIFNGHVTPGWSAHAD